MDGSNPSRPVLRQTDACEDLIRSEDLGLTVRGLTETEKVWEEDVAEVHAQSTLLIRLADSQLNARLRRGYDFT